MKKKKTKANKSEKSVMPSLPQNIIPVGERVFEDKNIYIHQKVYEQIHKFASNKTENEHGGILVGRVVNEMGKENTIIEGFIEARYNAATPTTLTFTHETWDYFHAEIDKKHKNKKIVGWIHTHPNFGIFLSENDRFIQENFFTDSNQVAYVVDPIQHEEGFFFWINGKLERCLGFYLFDKNGAKIKQSAWSSDVDADTETVKSDKSRMGFLSVAVVAIFLLNIFTMIYQSNRINALEKQVEDQNIVLRYGVYRGYGAPDISTLADSIRTQLEVNEMLKRQKAQDANVQTEQQPAESNEQKTQEDPANQAPGNEETNTENSGGKE